MKIKFRCIYGHDYKVNIKKNYKNRDLDIRCPVCIQKDRDRNLEFIFNQERKSRLYGMILQDIIWRLEQGLEVMCRAYPKESDDTAEKYREYITFMDIVKENLIEFTKEKLQEAQADELDRS